MLHCLPRISVILFLALAASVGSQSAGASASDEVLETHLTQIVATLPADARKAMEQIDGTARKLLAARSYLRARDSLRSRWSWTEAEIEAYEKSAQYADMVAEIQKVTTQFEKLNPGYTLYVNSQVRSVGVQLERWNKNRTVGTIGDELLKTARVELARAPAAADPKAAEQLRKLLMDWRLPAAVPLAAPGMSLHGQSRALDFQVRKGDRIVAGPDTTTIASVWQGQGWAQKVADAVKQGSAKFHGPLTVPNEPWHFEYRQRATGDGQRATGDE